MDFMDNTYTGLHQHSVYSVLDGFAKVEDIVIRAKKLEMRGVCISDHGSMAGAFELNRLCKKHDMKPIFANELYLAPTSNLVKERLEGFRPSYHILLIAENNVGYKNLMRITSDSWIRGKYYKSRTDLSKLAEFREGIIVLSACIGGMSQQLFLENREEEAEDHILAMKRIFGKSNYFLEVQYSGLKEQELVNQFYLKMAKKHDLNVVITADSHYVEKEDSKYHNALVTINTNGRLKKKETEQGSLIDDSIDTDESGMYYTPGEYFMKSTEDLLDSKQFNDFPEAFAITNEIADRCNVDFIIGQKYIPDVPGIINADDTLSNTCTEWLNRFFLEKKFGADLEQEYKDRLSYELDIIKKMEFSMYFLVVAEYAQWAKDNGIIMGKGRGSAAGSLVAYTSNITDVDPIRYGLLFERFLSRGRAKLPLIESKSYTYEQYLKDKE